MTKTDLNWERPHRREAAKEFQMMVEQYGNMIQSIAPTSLSDAAKALSKGLENPLISNGEFVHLMSKFCDELAAVNEQSELS